MADGSKRFRVSDEEILRAVEGAVEDGCRDILAGGVPVAVVAERVGITENPAADRLRALSRDGELVCVDGARPERPYRPRQSYLPPETAERIAETTQFNGLDKNL